MTGGAGSPSRVVAVLARATHTAFGAIVGGVFGLAVTLALVVISGRFGRYIFAVHDLAAVRLETVPALLGVMLGGWMAYRRPAAFWRAALMGLAGIAGGATALGLLTGLLSLPTEWRWTAGLLGGVVAGWALLLRSLWPSRLAEIPPRPPQSGHAIWVGLTVVAIMFVTVAAFDVGPVSDEEDFAPDLELHRAALPPFESVESVLFLVGDAGQTVEGRSPLLEALRHDVERWAAVLPDSSVAVAFLGDLVYPVGIREKTHPEYARDSTRLWNQIDLLSGRNARSRGAVGLFLAGNHDWGNTLGDGIDRIENLEAELEVARNAGIAVALEPPGGSAGPSVRQLGEHLTLAMLDTHWFLQNPEGPETDAFVARVDSLMRNAGSRRVILAAHHPYRSAGPHGAIIPTYYRWGVGLILQKTGSLVQDLNSRAYAGLLSRMESVFRGVDDRPLMFAGGHDHSLQVMSSASDAEPDFSVVSGSGSKVSAIERSEALDFGATRPGYMMIVTTDDGSIRLYVVAGDRDRLLCPDADPDRSECMVMGENSFDIAYSRLLAGSGPDSPDRLEAGNGKGWVPWWTTRSTEGVRDLDEDADRSAPPVAVPLRMLAFDPDSVVTTPGAEYDAGPVARVVAGDLHRRLWTIPITLPVLDLDTLGGGVRVEELTGGFQTMGARFRARNGLRYQFRSIVKDARATVPGPLRETDVSRVVNDQMAAQFPLAAMVVAELLEAAGAHVARPTPVVMPNSGRLGPYRPLLAGRVGWIQEFPDERDGGRPGFAGSTRIVDGEMIFDTLAEDPTYFVAPEAFLRLRLIDILVGDWDRHIDQWRWASFPDGDRTRWDPIPRDRDWAFHRSDGVAGTLSRIFLRRFVGFDGSYPPVDRLVETGAELDRRFLTTLGEEDFVRIAATLSTSVFSDSVLRRAVAVLPQPYGAEIGEGLLAALEQRRDGLIEVAREYHRHLARQVEATPRGAAGR